MSDASQVHVYVHRKRPQWGYAIVAWEKGDKRGYQFEDGQLRVFKDAFYGLFDRVDPSGAGAVELVEELNPDRDLYVQF